MIEKRKWGSVILSSSDKAYIRKHWYDMKHRDIAQKLGIEESTLRYHTLKMNLQNVNKRINPTEEQLKYIKENIASKTAYQIAKELGFPKNKVYSIVDKLGIKYDERKYISDIRQEISDNIRKKKSFDTHSFDIVSYAETFDFCTVDEKAQLVSVLREAWKWDS